MGSVPNHELMRINTKSPTLTRNGWAKLALHRLIRDLGEWIPRAVFFFKILKISQSLKNEKRRSQHLVCTQLSKQASKHVELSELLIERFPQRKMNPMIPSLFEQLYE